MEIDQVAVDRELWQKAQAGDVEARTEIRKRINGLELYFHFLPILPTETVVTLRALEAVNVIESVRISA